MSEIKIRVLIFVTILIDIISFSTILPVFPLILDYYAYRSETLPGIHGYLLNFLDKICYYLNLEEPKKYINVLLAGLLGFLFSYLQFLSSPIFGALSDVVGRKPVLMISMSGISLSYLIWAKADKFSIFLISRIIGGICKANVSILIATATDITKHTNRGKIMAIIGSAFSLGFIIGPSLGGLYSNFYGLKKGSLDAMHQCFTSLALLSFSLSLVNLFFVWQFMPETHVIKLKQDEKVQKKHYMNWSCFASIRDYLDPVSIFSFKPFICSNAEDKKGLQVLGMIYFLYLFLFSGLEFTLSFFVHLRFHFTSMDQGRMFCFIGIVMIITQGGFLRRVSPNKEKEIALGALLLLIPSNLLIAFSYNKIVFYVGLFLHSLSTSMAVPCLSALVSYYDTPNQRGVLMGIHRSLGSLARALGPLFASFVFWLCGPTFCYTLGALLHVIPPLILYRWFY